METEEVWGLRLNEHFEALLKTVLFKAGSLYNSIRTGLKRSDGANLARGAREFGFDKYLGRRGVGERGKPS